MPELARLKISEQSMPFNKSEWEGINIENQLDFADNIPMAGDNDPMYAIVEIARSNKRSGNGRLFTDGAIREIYNQVVGTQGYLGHPDPEKEGHEFREPHSMYVGAELTSIGDSLRLLGKVYIYPESPLRRWLPIALEAGNPLTVSIFGPGKGRRDNFGANTYTVEHVTLQSIDWANPNTQGMSNSESLNIVSEMLNDPTTSQGGNKMEGVNLQTLTIAELQSANPALYGNVLANITVAELKQHAPKIYTQIEEDLKVSEMTLSVNNEEKTVALTAVQGILDAKDIVISELQGKIDAVEASELRETLIAEMLTEKDGNDKYRASISRRIATMSDETQIRETITAELGYIAEMVQSMGGNFSGRVAGNVARHDNGNLGGGNVDTAGIVAALKSQTGQSK